MGARRGGETRLRESPVSCKIRSKLCPVLTTSSKNFGSSPSLQGRIYRTAQALAADRATKSLPVFAAQIIFIITIGVSIFRTADVANSGSNAFNNTIFVNIEVYSIAFSALYFWVIPTVIFASLIGVSQTEAAIPRILERFQDDLNHRKKLRNKISLPNAFLADSERRKFHGGIYQWQPSKYRSQAKPLMHKNGPDSTQGQLNDPNQPEVTQSLIGDRKPEKAHKGPRANSNIQHMIFAHVIIIAGAVTGFIISSLVPPGGFGCRHIGELSILTAWLVSAYLDILLNKIFSLNGRSRKCFKWDVKSTTMLFWMTFVKDIISTAATMGGVILTQIGILNRCECYSKWGMTGLALPQIPDVNNVLRDRINNLYPIVTGLGLCFQLIVVLAYMVWQYGSALQVYIQRDDNKSSWPDWLQSFGPWWKKTTSKCTRRNPSLGKGIVKRDTSTLEKGDSLNNAPQKMTREKSS